VIGIGVAIDLPISIAGTRAADLLISAKLIHEGHDLLATDIFFGIRFGIRFVSTCDSVASLVARHIRFTFSFGTTFSVNWIFVCTIIVASIIVRTIILIFVVIYCRCSTCEKRI